MRAFSLNCSGRLIEFRKPAVMGILNITPDSFYDAGQHKSEKLWIEHTEKMLQEGADIIDVGAVSTRPGGMLPDIEEEKKRILPALNSLRKKFPEIIISVDTYRAEIAELAIREGADIINDISAGSFDDKMFETIAGLNVPYIIMHIKGTPANMQINPEYEDVVKEISAYFSEKINKLRSLGVKDIIIDPGFGFGKDVGHNYEILNMLEFFNIFNLPVLVGFSRKSMINRVLQTKPDSALNGTTVLNTIALMKNVSILRVHDVLECVQAVRLVEELHKNVS